MAVNPYPFPGLTDTQIDVSRQQNGSNALQKSENDAWWQALKEAATEPMFLLLVTCSVIYFSLGELSEGFFMLGAILLVSAISFYQDSRSKKALEALKAFTQSAATVIRNNQLTELPVDELVMGDTVVISEGELIPADGKLLQINDFSVNESLLTGEAFTIYKDLHSEENGRVYRGALVQSGQGIFEVTAVGKQSKLGKIGQSLSEIQPEKTPLQRQIENFVKKMAAVGLLIFLVIWGINYMQSRDVLGSLLKGLTIAMSVLPEEIPVAFASFMALGARRLMQQGIIVKQTQTVETLGSATVICTDKTGTITENKMELHRIFVMQTNEVLKAGDWTSDAAKQLISTAMWASEPVPFDPMEKALHQAYQTIAPVDERPQFRFVHEYPLSGKPPMMTHIFENEAGKRIIAGKGAPEALLKHSTLSEEQKLSIHQQISDFAVEGFRVLGVAQAEYPGNDFPKNQQDFKFRFLGLVGFYDPPKKNIAKVFKQFYDAGIQLKIITGDNSLTTAAIAKQAHFKSNLPPITGEELLTLSPEEQADKISKASIFTRMFPEAKLKIITTLKDQHQIVGMTGDGVNDGPALKAAHIGIAMGKRGSEIAKQASSLILVDDDFSKMADAVAMGRKIYTNLKKAIQYIISIHIPIILTVALPLILGWVYPAIFTPVHVIFLELVMGPTCSIVYENEPLERNAMKQPPRPLSTTFLNLKELSISLIQGLMITLGTLFSYQYAIANGYDENLTRTMVFTTLVLANVFLTLVNRSFRESVFTTLRYKNDLLVGIIGITLFMVTALVYIPAFASFFKLSPLSLPQLGIAVSVSFLSVIWFEGYKWVRRKE
ncbi:cation-translocating P-type ATPase [Runella slithyformis]|uniref:ATPase, P-type (Transporting), HAD superfamily, subfamily IC n=1 Tax=Runella slithyformis (strain ATCC 29530 / DSM 19594 / LMG 11500 / NCIMB 11436 / LSU 4) TaxID=761193 RepID=A0A7U4E6S0_RUNSL|nr:cation-translocating P-type ATPase [Runella slithyformis]AEI49893.1 ATPase, P-type (transporting), HAD superfamily, subfamily IC [Runella slithyformis DSM 19594]